MRYQKDNKYRRYVQGYGFLSFARKLNMVKNLLILQ